MSFSLHAYLIDRPLIENIFDSKDKELQNKLLSTYKEELHDLRMIVDVDYSPIEALKDIIAGQIAQVQDTEVHTHIVRLFCQLLGKTLENSEWQNMSMNWLMDINQTAALPISKIPPPQNFPYVITIPPDKLEDFLLIMGGLELEEAAWNQFEGWIKSAKNEQKHLILFFY